MARYVADWIFCLVPTILVAFYSHWIYISIYRPPLEELLVDFPRSDSSGSINAGLANHSSNSMELSDKIVANDRKQQQQTSFYGERDQVLMI
jgi:hypothetical protein